MTVDLTTRYLGLQLQSPLVASAGPLTGSVDSLLELEQAGCSAAVLPSLFEEQLTHDQHNLHALYEYQSYSFAESLSYFPELEDYNVGPHSYLRHIEHAKQELSIPIIASINGASPGGWTGYSKSMQDAGADALELNIYHVPTDPEATAADVERQYIDIVAEVKNAISIPLAVKIGPQFTSLPNFARQLQNAGADGLVLFNRYLEPDVDLESLQISPHLILSQRHELRTPLRWIAIIRDQTAMSLAASSGVHFAEDVVKLLLVGADVVMTTSAVLKNGPGYLREMHDWLRGWLDINEYESVEQLKGSMSYANCPNPGALERGNYMKALISYTSPS